MEQQEPSNRRGKSICLPCQSEADYVRRVDDPQQFRQWLEQLSTQHPELFPAAIRSGFTLHDSHCSVKQGLRLHRLKLKATGAVYLVRPSAMLTLSTFVSPCGMAKLQHEYTSRRYE